MVHQTSVHVHYTIETFFVNADTDNAGKTIMIVVVYQKVQTQIIQFECYIRF